MSANGNEMLYGLQAEAPESLWKRRKYKSVRSGKHHIHIFRRARTDLTSCAGGGEQGVGEEEEFRVTEGGSTIMTSPAQNRRVSTLHLVEKLGRYTNKILVKSWTMGRDDNVDGGRGGKDCPRRERERLD